nr:MAG TPA: hypothetical protein [Crassvirales sp.]DAR56544.1 MAG TPA: hypothetical protein [Crassvirales sp.]
MFILHKTSCEDLPHIYDTDCQTIGKISKGLMHNMYHPRKF